MAVFMIGAFGEVQGGEWTCWNLQSPRVQKPSATRAGVRLRPVPSGKRLPMAGKVQKIDLVSQAFARDPFPTYASLREAGPVFQTRLPFLGKTWVATTYQAASEVLKDDAFVMEAKNAGKTRFSGILRLMPRTVRVVSEHMLTRDNPDHRRLRRLVEQAFSRHSVENMRGPIGVLCDGLLDGLASKQAVDLLAEWARPLPVAVICELLGLPDEDRPKFTRWANALFSMMSVFG